MHENFKKIKCFMPDYENLNKGRNNSNCLIQNARRFKQDSNNLKMFYYENLNKGRNNLKMLYSERTKI